MIVRIELRNNPEKMTNTVKMYTAWDDSYYTAIYAETEQTLSTFDNLTEESIDNQENSIKTFQRVIETGSIDLLLRDPHQALLNAIGLHDQVRLVILDPASLIPFYILTNATAEVLGTKEDKISVTRLSYELESVYNNQCDNQQFTPISCP